jgi:hypothetical protein
LAAATNKKVTVVRFDREPLPGFVQMGAFLAEGGLELLSPAGTISLIPYADIKAVCFVKDWDGAGALLEKKVFASRPKQEGLWVRLDWRDGDFLEALLPNRLLELEPQGFTVNTPDAGAQRIFVPRSALRAFTVQGVIGVRQAGAKRGRVPHEQLKMFE